jgi:hypothetical protein
LLEVIIYKFDSINNGSADYGFTFGADFSEEGKVLVQYFEINLNWLTNMSVIKKFQTGSSTAQIGQSSPKLLPINFG